MQNYNVFKVFFIFFYFFVVNNFAQEVPPISIYSMEDYGAENQNWAISQDSDKIIYVANNRGLLEFNGANWQLYSTPNETIMRSVKCFEDNIYTGFHRDFGFWKRDVYGTLKYTSIVEKTKIEMLEDEQIWEIHELDGWMIFKSLQRIYLYNLTTDAVKIIESTKMIPKLSKVENIIYFQELGKGVFMIENGVPKLVSDDEIVKSNKIVEFMFKDDKLFLVTQKNGFYFLEDNKLTKWQVSSDEFLTNKTIYSALQLKSGNIVLGTISNGFVKIYANGDLFYTITQGLGLSNNTVLSVFEDADLNIWLGLDSGLNTINMPSPFKVFTKKTKFWGTIYASIIHDDKLYLGTNQGLFYRNKNSFDDFELIKNTEGQVWNLQQIEGTLFCSHDSGTFVITNNNANLINGTSGTWSVRKINENTLIQGNYDGLYILKRKNESWELKNKIKGFYNSSRYVVVKDSTTFLVNHEYKGVYRIKVDADFNNVVKVEKDNSIEKSIHSSLIKYHDDILYGSKNGVYKYNFKEDYFELDSVYSQLIPHDKFVSGKLLYDGVSNKLWSFTEDDLRYLAPGKLSKKPDLQIIPIKGTLHKGASGFENIIHLNDKIYLIGTVNGYLKIDLSNIIEPEDFKVSINKIFNYKVDNPKTKVNLSERKFFNNKENNLEFFYSVTNYNKTSSIKYQYKLEGLNEKWSNFSQTSSYLYENLPFGDYTFKVKASIDNKTSTNIAEYSFTINKPWYLSNTLIIIYCISFIIIVFGIHLIYKRYYKKQREKLLSDAQLELEMKELESSQKIIKLNNDKLRNDIQSKNRELATSTMSIIKKNDFLNTIKIELLAKGKDSIPKVVKIIDKNLNNTDDWKMFQEAFNNADKNFLKKIKATHPDLTPNDLRLCAYLRLNLSSKEIAPLLNISPRSVEVKRYRLRKKMDLPHNANLTNYILEI